MTLFSNVIKDEFEPKLSRFLNSNDEKWYCRKALSQLTFDIIFKANFGQNMDFENDPICKELARDLIDSLWLEYC